MGDCGCGKRRTQYAVTSSNLNATPSEVAAASAKNAIDNAHGVDDDLTSEESSDTQE